MGFLLINRVNNEDDSIPFSPSVRLIYCSVKSIMVHFLICFGTMALGGICLIDDFLETEPR